MRRFMPFLIAFLVAAAVSGGLAFLAAAAHQPPSSAPYLPGALIGMVTAVVLLGLGGNRKVAFGSKTQRDAALAMAPPSGQALIYVFRKSLTGQALGLDVTLDDAAIAQIRSGRFTCCPVSPGPHRLTVLFASSMMKKVGPTSVDINTNAGNVYVYKVENVMGLVENTVQVTPITDLGEARRILAGMRMVMSDAPER